MGFGRGVINEPPNIVDASNSDGNANMNGENASVIEPLYVTFVSNQNGNGYGLSVILHR